LDNRDRAGAALMFRRTTSDISRLLEMIGRPWFNDARMLQVECEADPENVRLAVPQEFELAIPVRVMLEVGHWGDSPVGAFGGGGVYVPCTYGEFTGLYVLAMYMDTAAAIAFGRELFGEPKRQATVTLDETDTSVHGVIERHGVRIIDIAVARETETRKPAGVSRNFNTLVRWVPDGTGIEGDVTVNMATFEIGSHLNVEGHGTLALTDGPHDVLSELGIREPVGASFVHGDVSARNQHVGSLPPEAFLPHAFARYDDWLRLAQRR
jgi:acetoacetate decarboxylase